MHNDNGYYSISSYFITMTLFSSSLSGVSEAVLQAYLHEINHLRFAITSSFLTLSLQLSLIIASYSSFVILLPRSEITSFVNNGYLHSYESH